MRPPNKTHELAVLCKIDPNFVNRKQVEFLLISVFSLRYGIQDGLYQAVKYLAPILEEHQAWMRAYIPAGERDSLMALHGLAAQLTREDTNFISETQSSLDENNPLFGRFTKNKVLACWTGRSLVAAPEQAKWTRFLRACLFVWRTNHPCPPDNEKANFGVSSNITSFCSALRELVSTPSMDVAWPDFSDNPISNLRSLANCISKKGHPLFQMAEGVRELSSDFGSILSKIQKSKQAEKPPKPSPTPPAYYPKRLSSMVLLKISLNVANNEKTHIKGLIMLNVLFALQRYGFNTFIVGVVVQGEKIGLS